MELEKQEANAMVTLIGNVARSADENVESERTFRREKIGNGRSPDKRAL